MRDYAVNEGTFTAASTCPECSRGVRKRAILAFRSSTVGKRDGDRLVALTSALTLTSRHTGLRLTTPIVISELRGPSQTIWDTMKRHFGLEITKPLLYL